MSYGGAIETNTDDKVAIRVRGRGRRIGRVLTCLMTFIVAIVSSLALCISHILPRSMSYSGLTLAARAALCQEQQGWVGLTKGSPASDTTQPPETPQSQPPMVKTTTRQLHRSQSLSSNTPIILHVNQYKTGVIADTIFYEAFSLNPLAVDNKWLRSCITSSLLIKMA